MEQDELIELRQKTTDLQNIIDSNGVVSVVFTADTGKAALLIKGEYYKIRNVIRRRMDSDPALIASGERALELVDEVEEGLAKYIRDYGKLPPEICIQ